MCRSVYLSGLLMSHGTDSVLTRRATTRKKAQRGIMKHCGRPKLNNTCLIVFRKLGEILYQTLLNVKNEQIALS